MANYPDLTFASFLQDLLDTFYSHEQINTVHTGILSDLDFPKASGSSRSVAYPYVFILKDAIISQANHGSSFLTIQLNIIFMDRYVDNELSIVQAQSNMMSLATDTLAYYSVRTSDGPPYWIDNTFKISFTPFVEQYRDRVAGVSASVQFIIEQPLGRLFTPFAGTDPADDPIQTEDLIAILTETEFKLYPE